jgi:ribosomal protein S8
MPRFSEYTNVDICVDDFLIKCSSHEIKEVIDWLRDGDYINNNDLLDDDEGSKSALQELYEENIEKIRRAYLQISKEDFETINMIAKKY